MLEPDRCAAVLAVQSSAETTADVLAPELAPEGFACLTVIGFYAVTCWLS